MSSEAVKRHPQLLAILAAVLEGKPLREVAETFTCPLAELQVYAREAGLLPGRDPELRPPEPDAPCSEQAAEDEGAGEVYGGLEDERAIRGRNRSSSELTTETPKQAAEAEIGKSRKQPLPDQGTYPEASRVAMRQELERIDMERRAYEEQPRPHLTLASDPGFHTGFQSESRLRALITREQLDKAERVRQWYAADPFRWRQPPPDDL